MIRRLLWRLLSLFCVAALIFTFSACEFLEGIPFPTLPSFGSPSTSEQNREEEAANRTVIPSEQLPSDFSEKYKNQLGQNEQAVYNAISESAPGEKITVTFPLPFFIPCDKRGEPLPEENEQAQNAAASAIVNGMLALWLDDPAFFWMEFGMVGDSFQMDIRSTDAGNQEIRSATFTVKIKELYAENTASHIDALRDAAAAVPVSGETVEEKVASINAYLCGQTKYDREAPRAHEALGVFLDGRAVCEGYARAFQILCDLHGISSAVVVGKGVTKEGTEGHMWNLVLLEDGNYYAVDTTWNDSTESSVYLLCGANSLCHGEAFSETHLPAVTLLQGARSFAPPSLVIFAEEEQRPSEDDKNFPLFPLFPFFPF